MIRKIPLFFEHQDFYLKLWKEGVNNLFRFLKENVPNCKVIVNKARYIDEYIDKETGKIKIISQSGRMGCLNVRFGNAWWDVIDDHVIYNYDVRVIDYGDKVYRSFEDHPWGMFYVHYDMSFYQDFSRKSLYFSIYL